ncbi:DUF5993 family protein [Burkholderia ubonensis]|uniref:DUF5993 family protein n=1 Tax=Burkholderia ubonensis TaxID=101571 RepID=UPI000AA4E2F4
MFIGIIPFVSAAVALVLSLLGRDRPARALWWLTVLLSTAWAIHHGWHHIPQFATYGSW